MAVREPTPPFFLVPRHILQQDGPSWRRQRRLSGAIASMASVVVHLAILAGFVALLTWRTLPPVEEIEIPVELVAAVPEPPKPASPKADAPKPAALKLDAPATPSAPQSAQSAPPPKPIEQALAPPVAADPKPPAPASVQPPTPPVPQPEEPIPPKQTTAPPQLVAPPPDPTRAATQDHDDKAANLVPDQHQADQATRESRPAAIPRMLTTIDPRALFAVPAQAEPKPNPTEKPTPDVPAKAPSETDKLAAALPMDISGMPMSFRAVLSGNGAQVSAAYKGLVYGRFNRDPEVAERARRQRLKGQVIVTFSIDDMGRIKDLSVLQTSGNPAVDALGLDMIRAAAPFPPPPPEAQRSFTPAFAFGGP